MLLHLLYNLFFFSLLDLYTMNFNLISPIGNGHTFNVRFKEPIIIPENSSVHLNWAQFERDNFIRFTEQQTIKLKPIKVVPHYDVANNNVSKNERPAEGWTVAKDVLRNPDDLTVKIPAGKYTTKTLQSIISKGFYNLRNAASLTGTRGDSTMAPRASGGFNTSMNFNNQTIIIPSVSNNPNFLAWGYASTSSNTFFTGSARHHLNNQTVDGIYQSTATGTGFTAVQNPIQPGNGANQAGTYNSFILSAENYIQYGGQFHQYQQRDAGGMGKILNPAPGFDELLYENVCMFGTAQNLDDQQGNVFVGLYSELYAGILDGAGAESSLNADADKITANTIKLSTDTFVPKCYFGVEITGNSAALGDNRRQLKVYANIMPQADGSNIGSNIAGSMPMVFQQDLTQVLPRTDVPVEFGFQTYFDIGNNAQFVHYADKATLFLRVFIVRPDGTKLIIYDTNTNYPHGVRNGVAAVARFASGFFDVFNSDVADPKTINYAQARATIPFNVLMSATTTGEGCGCSFQSIRKDFQNRTSQILLDHSFLLSTELAELFTPASTVELETDEKSGYLISYAGIQNFLFQTTLGQSQDRNVDDVNMFYVRENQLLGQYRTDKLSVILNTLPIKSFKNTNDKSKSGIRKPILANIPAPFTGANVEIGENGTIVGQYAPSLGVNSRLSNQAMTTNNFDIEIRDLENDTIATQLTKSIVNFTITSDDM